MTKTPAHASATFALFAYNQEKHIRDSVNGAFEQNYHPLKIILSDDCSSDHTFEIMQEMVATYNGPHEVILRQSPVNRGLLEHINNVADLVETDIVIVAAGDDISHADRTTILAKVFDHDPSIMAVLSDFHRLEQADVKIGIKKGCKAEYIPMETIISEAGGVGIGATYAYKKECFHWPWRLNSALISEDRILPLRGSILGRVCKVHVPLVFYRKSDDGLVSKLQRERKWAVSYLPHLKEVRREIGEALQQNRLSAKQHRTLMRILLLRSTFARLDRKRGRYGDAIPRLTGRALYRLYGLAFKGWLNQTFKIENFPK
jgi:cellulose synthase/poly-beta-1,6-N-acetylglucosamine synthase-like glycosyltransferase